MVLQYDDWKLTVQNRHEFCEEGMPGKGNQRGRIQCKNRSRASVPRLCLHGNSPCFNGFIDGVYFLSLSSAKFRSCASFSFLGVLLTLC